LTSISVAFKLNRLSVELEIPSSRKILSLLSGFVISELDRFGPMASQSPTLPGISRLRRALNEWWHLYFVQGQRCPSDSNWLRVINADHLDLRHLNFSIINLMKKDKTLL
jgi:hypothetical protein